jgi:protein SHQ1
VTIWKEEEKIWDNLDLLSNLVNRSDGVMSITEQESKISVLSSTESENNHEECDGCDYTEESLKSKSLIACLRPTYGFLNSFHSMLKDYCREGLSHDMLEIPEPDEIPNEDRRDLRILTENQKFDPDRYLGDLFLSNNPEDDDADMIFIEATQMVPHWQNSQVETSNDNITNFFSDEESLRLVEIKANLPNIESSSPEQRKSLFLSLVDILYAYAYDHRTTSGEPTCESSWTIAMLSPTLSWFESYTPPYDDVAQVLRWSIRRALTYPYLRNFHFVSEILVKDVGDIINAGRRVIIRCLLHIQKNFGIQ